MELRSLRIQGFRSFQEEVVIEFDGPGFFLMTGENKSEPALGANGVGKSSVWDALCWAFFGKTARGLRAGAVGNWEAEHACRVDVEFIADGSEWMLTRTWKPNSLLVQEKDSQEAKPFVQGELEKLLGFDYTTFLHTVLMGQFNQYFFDLPPAEKLRVFSEALELQLWLDVSDKAKRQASKLDAAMRDLERRRSLLEGRSTVLRREKRELKEALARYEFERKDRLDAAGKNIKALHKEVAKNDKQLESAQNSFDDLCADLSGAQEAAAKMQLDVESVRVEHRAAELDCGSVETQLKHQQAERSRFSRARNICPACNQKISKEHVQKMVEAVDKKKASLIKRLEEMEEHKADKAGALEGLKKALSSQQAHIDELQNKRVELNKKLGWHKSQKSRYDLELRQALDREAELEGESNPHADRLKKLIKEYKKTKNDKQDLEDEMWKVEEQFDHATFWARGFKELRLWLIEESLEQFRVEVNNSLLQLGLDGWAVAFDVERETKSGGVSRGFTVMITAPDSAEAVPWEAWSGGETQRLRIAGAIGLSNLIKNQSGINWPLEVWDEPTAHLSEEGIDDLLDFFDSRAREQELQLWLVDHRSLSYGGFDGELRLVKDESGTHLA